MFRTVPLSIIRSFSLYTQQWYMSYRFADSLLAGSGRSSKQMHQFLKCIFGIKLYMFRTVPLSIISSFSLCAQEWYMSYMFADSLEASCQQTCMYSCTYSEKPLVIDRGTVRNMQSFIPKIKFGKQLNLVTFIIRIYHDSRSPERQYIYIYI